MKKILLITILIISGCSGRFAIMKHPATGDIKTCEVSAGSEMLTGAFISGMTQRKCVKGWKNAGYEEVKDKQQ